jgi:hypothetical protein
MNRRGFLRSMLAAAAAPYVITTAGVLMPVRQIVTGNELFAGGLGEYLDVIVRCSMPLSPFGISGSSVLIGNEESLSLSQISQRIPLNPMKRGDSVIVGKLPPGARVLTIHSSHGAALIEGGKVRIQLP